MHRVSIVFVIILALGLSACVGHRHHHHRGKVVIAPPANIIVVHKPIRGKRCWQVPGAWRCYR